MAVPGSELLLSAALVDRWFAAVDDPPALPYLQLRLTADERSVIDGGHRAVLAAVIGSTPPSTAEYAGSGEFAAMWLAAYLDGLAAGIGGARSADGGEPGAGTPLHLVAGLIAGAAAVSAWDHGAQPARSAEADLPGLGLSSVSAVETAHRAGAGAAEEAVMGADLPTVAHAAAVGVIAWIDPTPGDPAEAPARRAQVLLARLLSALDGVCRPGPATADALPESSPGWLADCRDQPWQNSGLPFLAEITLATMADGPTVGRLAAVLRGRGDWVGLWGGGSRGSGLHVHTTDSGGALSEIYSVLTPFDLQVSQLPS